VSHVFNDKHTFINEGLDEREQVFVLYGLVTRGDRPEATTVVIAYDSDLTVPLSGLTVVAGEEEWSVRNSPVEGVGDCESRSCHVVREVV
jgi:hypothetical protein